MKKSVRAILIALIVIIALCALFLPGYLAKKRAEAYVTELRSAVVYLMSSATNTRLHGQQLAVGVKAELAPEDRQTILEKKAQTDDVIAKLPDPEKENDPMLPQSLEALHKAYTDFVNFVLSADSQSLSENLEAEFAKLEEIYQQIEPFLL